MNCFGGNTYSCKDCMEKFLVYKHLDEDRNKLNTSSKYNKLSQIRGSDRKEKTV